MSDTPTIRPAEGVEFLPVGTEGVLFDRIGQRLLHLNPLAACIWCHLENEGRLGAVVDATARSIRAAPALVSGDVLQMIGTWRNLGLLDGSVGQRFHRGEPQTQPPTTVTAATVPAPNGMRRRYRVLDTTFSLGFPTAEMESIVHPVIAHLETRFEAAEICQLDLVEAEGSFRVQQNGRDVASCAVRDSLAPFVQGILGLLATREYPYLMALHAAGLGASGSALLLTGRSRSGKSVLAAALVAAGWEYLSDDTVLLVPETLEAVGVPYSLGIKRGGWKLVTSHCPSLERTGMHLRQDGLQVRYFLPPAYRNTRQRWPVRWIGFPSRAQGRAGGIQPLGQLEGLRRMFEHCCAVPRPLTSDDVRCLIRWSSTARFFDLSVGDLDTAIARLRTLVREDESAPSRPSAFGGLPAVACRV